ncbi:MAG: hypothetical protein JXQ93_08995 [Flavobacteriaceae bacterium]
MKKVNIISGILLFLVVLVNAQEKKIKFNKGTLKICSSKLFQIEGYDGDEVIIKSLHEKRESNMPWVVRGTADFKRRKSQKRTTTGYARTLSKRADSVVKGQYVFFNTDSNRKKGLKKLGKKSQNADLGIYFTIEQKDGELLFKDQNRVSFIMASNEKYLIKIPNSIKLKWQTNNCNKESSNNQVRFFNSRGSSLSNFEGEVEIASTLNNMRLKDVTGPVVVNTVGGNVTIEFEKKYPKGLYSVYSNNGFIDVQIPQKSSLLIDAIGKSVYSDVDFEVLDEDERDDFGNINTRMKLKYGGGKFKMKLNSGYGTVYLRKKESEKK